MNVYFIWESVHSAVNPMMLAVMPITMEAKLQQLIREGESHTFSDNCERMEHDTYGRPSPAFQSWVAEIEDFIITNYGEDSSPWRVFERFDINGIGGNYQDAFEEGKRTLLSALNSCLRIEPKMAVNPIPADDVNLANLFYKFHLVVKQLRNRYNARTTLDVEDEYDVQDLLHALLRLHFEDIRAEEWTPSYAGGTSRMDFLLKREKTVIEVKKTRKGLADKELGKQLIEDKEKYKNHPDCKKLICFVYDPEGRVVNPRGIEDDLNSTSDGLEITVTIKP